jgi:hypothetical protein
LRKRESEKRVIMDERKDAYEEQRRGRVESERFP